MKLIDFARAYSERQGWSCIPCEPCGKKALVSWKTYQERLPDDTELKDFFAGYDHRNLAIITGDVSNRLLVVDFDILDLFVAWWKDIFRRSTLGVVTGKGVHFYFRLAEGEPPIHCGKIVVQGKPTGDIRYNGGYVLAPPSIHPNGTRYKWIDAPLLTVKFKELKLERPKTGVTKVQQRPAKMETSETIERPRAYAEAALRRECEKVQTATEGTRNTQLYESAVKLAKYRQIIGVEWIRIRLINAASLVGLKFFEASRTVNSGLNRAVVRSV